MGLSRTLSIMLSLLFAGLCPLAVSPARGQDQLDIPKLVGGGDEGTASVRQSWEQAKFFLCLRDGPGGCLWSIKDLDGIPIPGQQILLSEWSGDAVFSISSSFAGEALQLGPTPFPTLKSAVLTGVLENGCGVGYAVLLFSQVTCDEGSKPETVATILGFSTSPEMISYARANSKWAAQASSPQPGGTDPGTSPGTVPQPPPFPPQAYTDRANDCKTEAKLRHKACLESYRSSQNAADFTFGLGLGIGIGTIGAVLVVGVASVLTCGAAAAVAGGVLLAGGAVTGVGAKKMFDYGQLEDTANYRYSVSVRCCEETMDDWRQRNQNPSNFGYPFKECEFICPDPSVAPTP